MENGQGIARDECLALARRGALYLDKYLSTTYDTILKQIKAEMKCMCDK
jgi:hypothetical protein